MPVVRKNLSRLKNILSKEQTKILETAFILMLPAFLTKVLGQVFLLVVASLYSVEDSRFNQFVIANTIPELLTSVLMVGAVGTVIIPVLITSKAKDGEQRFYEVYSSILNAAIIVFSVISLIIIIFADKFIPFAINLADANILTSPAELTNIANMMRAMILPQLLLGISVFISSGLNVYNRYLLPQLSGLFFNLGKLGTAIIFIPLMDKSPWALVVAVYVGAFLHLIIQIPLFISLRLKYYPRIEFKDPYLKEIFKLGLPRMVVLASDQIGIAVNKFLSAAFLGGPAALNLAISLYLVIPSVFGYTFSYASYPTLARLFIENNLPKLREIFFKTINEIFFMSLPFVVTLMILRVPIVRLFFGISPNTQLTLIGSYQIAWILLFFSIGLAFITARWFILSMFFASKDTVTPSLISIFSLIAVITLSILFTNFLSHNQNFAISTIEFNLQNFFNRADPAGRAGVAGISLAMSLVYSVEFVVMVIIIAKRKIQMSISLIFSSILKKFVAATVMAIFMYFTYKIWTFISYSAPEAGVTEGFTGSTSLNIFILTIVTVIPAFLIYYLSCLLLKVEELRILKKYLNPVFKIGGIKIPY